LLKNFNDLRGPAGENNAAAASDSSDAKKPEKVVAESKA